MALSFGYHGLVAFLLALARALGWLMLVPPFSNRAVIPMYVNIAVAAALGLLVGPDIPFAAIPTTTPLFLADLVLQVVTGAAIGFVVYLLISTIVTAGSFLDLMGGLNLPTAVDPLSLNQTPLIGQFYEQVAMVLLFVTGGYDLLVEGFARSFQAPGFTLAATATIAQTVVVDLATLFTSALEMAAPILVVLFAAQVLLALLSKAAPQMNVWVLGLPVQIFIAIALVAISVSTLPGYVDGLLTRALGDTAVLFRGH